MYHFTRRNYSMATTPTKKGPALPIIFLLITVGILVAGGYFIYTKVLNKSISSLTEQVPGLGSMVSNSMLPKLTENDFKDIEDPLIRKHLAKQYSQTKMMITSSSDGMDDNSQTTITTDYRSDKDYRMHMVQMMGGKETQNMITIGDTTYLKDPKDGKWWMQKAETLTEQSKWTEVAESFTPEDIQKEVMEKTKVTYKSLGQEACGSLMCHKYEEVSGDDSSSRIFWFDTQDLLLRKEQTGYGEYTTVTEYRYDNINVSAPSPTKEVPQGKSIYDMMADSYMEQSGYGDQLKDFESMMPSDTDLETMKNEMEQYFGSDSEPSM